MELLGVLLGWFLGIISTPILFVLNGFFEKRRFLKTIKEELVETKYRLILRINILRQQLGTMNRERLEWVVARIESCHRLDEVQKDYLLRQKKILQLSEPQLSAEFVRIYNEGMAISQMSTPYLSAKLDYIGLLNEVSQASLVNFLFHMDNLNAKATENSHWTNMSFTITDKGMVEVHKNINFCVTAWISSAEEAVECIDRFMKSII